MPDPNLQTDGNSTDFMKAIQDKLLGQSGVISSTNSQLETRLNNAISGVQTSADKANQSLQLDYGRQVGYTQDKFMRDQVNDRASGAGGVMNVAAYNALRDDTNKNLKDLEDRKQSLILQNDSAAASKVADLQFQALQFQQQAQQQTFSNLLGMANYGLQQKTSELAQRAQTFQESQAMSTVALQYGLEVKPGDTLASVTTRAMPLATKEEKLKLAKAQADINNANAQAAKYMSDSKAVKGGLDTLSAGVLAGNFLKSDSVMQAYILNNIKTTTDMATFQGALSNVKDFKAKMIDDSVPSLATKSVSEIQQILSTSNSSYSTDDVSTILAKVKQYQVQHPNVAKKEGGFWSSSFAKFAFPAMAK